MAPAASHHETDGAEGTLAHEGPREEGTPASFIRAIFFQILLLLVGFNSPLIEKIYS